MANNIRICVTATQEDFEEHGEAFREARRLVEANVVFTMHFIGETNDQQIARLKRKVRALQRDAKAAKPKKK